MWDYTNHGLSQQGVWVPFWTPKHLKRNPQDTQIFLCGIFKNPNLKLIIDFFHLLIIPMVLFNDIMLYFDASIHVNGWNMSIFWSPLKIGTPKDFTTANFRHPVSKSWLRHCWLPWPSTLVGPLLSRCPGHSCIFTYICIISILYVIYIFPNRFNSFKLWS